MYGSISAWCRCTHTYGWMSAAVLRVQTVPLLSVMLDAPTLLT